MTPERAKELITRQSQFPNWGNITLHMTNDEEVEIDRLWIEASNTNGRLSRADIVRRIAHGRDPLTGA